MTPFIFDTEVKCINLSAHFKLSEMIQSNTALKLGIKNLPTRQEFMNMKALCERRLEQLRSYVRCPVFISSGFRNKQLNAAVGGAENSYHTRGMAADIILPVRADVFRNLMWWSQNFTYDELIICVRGKSDVWVHLAYDPTPHTPKQYFGVKGYR